jgi:integrase
LKRPCEAWGRRDAATITRRDAICLLDEIKDGAPVSANRTQSVLVGLFNWAVEDELLAVNPLAGLRKRAKERPRQRVLGDTEIRLLWPALAAAPGATEDVAAALQALLLTGQRPGEVAGATQGELVAIEHPQDARWEIPASRMKARRPHVVPLAPMARALFVAAIARRRAQEDRIGGVRVPLPVPHDARAPFALAGARAHHRTITSRWPRCRGHPRITARPADATRFAAKRRNRLGGAWNCA